MASYALNISAEFPRSMPLKIAKMYITPNDSVVRCLRDEIVEDQQIRWKAIRDWVSSNISYEHDSQQFGSGDHWMLSRELISSGKGDCEDQAILLCSLLRAEGWGPDEVFVIIGGPKGEASHAWVSLKVAEVSGIPIWVNLEPTYGEGGSGKDIDYKVRERVYAFNDKFFYDFS